MAKVYKRFFGLVFVLLTVCLFSVATSSAAEVTIFGPQQFIRTSGAPDVYAGNFTGLFTDELSGGKIAVLNGNQAGENRVEDSISSAEIYLNGELVLGNSDFNKNVYIIEANVTLTETNSFSVELQSTPDSYLTVSFIQDIPSPSANITAVPDTIEGDETSTLTWASSYANECTIEPGPGSVDCNSSVTVSPEDTTTYTLTAAGPGGTSTASATVNVVNTGPAVHIIADPETIMPGESSTLSWTSKNMDSAAIDQGIGTVPVEGSITVSPVETTAYTITAEGQGGVVTDTVTVTVVYPPPTVSISASTDTIQAGESVTLSWSSQYADTCTIEPDIGDVDPNGSMSVTLANNTTYSITVTGPGGTASDSASVTVTYMVPVIEISADPEEVNINNTTTLTWNTSYATSVNIEPGIGSVDPDGSTTVTPTEDTTYTITASNAQESASETITVHVIPFNITITSPLDNSIISRSDVMVEGTIVNPDNLEAGVIVNGVTALVYGDQFVANHVPLEAGENAILAIATDSNGNSANKQIVVNEDIEEDYIRIIPNADSSISPFTMILTIQSSFTIVSPNLTYTGPGSIEIIDDSNENEFTVRVITEGTYYLTVESDYEGVTFSDTIAIQVVSQEGVVNLLNTLWDKMKADLLGGDIDSALDYFVDDARERYGGLFQSLGPERINDLFSTINRIELDSLYGAVANCGALRDEAGETYSYPVVFVKDENGLWKIMGF